MYNVHNSQIISLDTHFRDKRNTVQIIDFLLTERLIAHLSNHKVLYHKTRNHQNSVRQNKPVEEETPK
jgi:hypothetical protein